MINGGGNRKVHRALLFFSFSFPFPQCLIFNSSSSFRVNDRGTGVASKGGKMSKKYLKTNYIQE